MFTPTGPVVNLIWTVGHVAGLNPESLNPKLSLLSPPEPPSKYKSSTYAYLRLSQTNATFLNPP